MKFVVNGRVHAIVAAMLMALSFAVLVVFIATPIHSALFAIVPASGAVTPAQRASADTATTSYLITGSYGFLGTYSATERAHLVDVRSRLVWNVVVMLVSTVAVLVLRPTDAEWRRAAWWLGGVIVATAVLFEPIFILMHRMLFPGGNWVLPSSQYAITRVYPEAFFIGAWLVIGVVSVASLWGLSRIRKSV